jgi:hypothetical protein
MIGQQQAVSTSSGQEANGQLNTAIQAAETFLTTIEELVGPLGGLISILNGFGLGSEAGEGNTAQLEALIRRILLGEEGSGGLLAELLAGALSAGEDGEPSPLLKALQAALLASLLGGENGEQSPLLGILQQALLGGGEDGAPSPLQRAVQEALVGALAGDEQGDSPLAGVFNAAIGSIDNPDTPLGGAVLSARVAIEAEKTAVIEALRLERDEALQKLTDERNAALRELDRALNLALLKIRELLKHNGIGIDLPVHNESYRLSVSP